MLWLYGEGDLDIFEGFESMQNCGFSDRQVLQTNRTRHQIYNENGVLISLIPISDDAKFYSTIGIRLPSYTNCKVINNDEAEEIHAALLLLNETENVIASETPSESEILNSQYLLILTSILNVLTEGGNYNG